VAAGAVAAVAAAAVVAVGALAVAATTTAPDRMSGRGAGRARPADVSRLVRRRVPTVPRMGNPAAAIGVDVVLPVLGEAAALPWVLGRLPPGYRPLVVDNGSTDGSGGVARRLGATVVVEPRRGFGAACAAGLAAATAPIVAFCDADGSLDPRELPLVVAPVSAGSADLVLGARRPTTPGALPRHARCANSYLARRIRRASGASITDLGPMRAARRDRLTALGIADRHFAWPLEMVLRAAASGGRVVEVPMAHGPRIGRSKVTGTVRGTARTVWDMRRILAQWG
jgi:glycosyltransferase involved in cell wall biosynthesis